MLLRVMDNAARTDDLSTKLRQWISGEFDTAIYNFQLIKMGMDSEHVALPECLAKTRPHILHKVSGEFAWIHRVAFPMGLNDVISVRL